MEIESDLIQKDGVAAQNEGEEADDLDRTPPAAVRRLLRQEVGYGCPVPGCGNPYLEWNHFDPPWHVEHHHNPEGMIALCATHHDHADAGAFTPGQQRELKRTGAERNLAVRGRFNWMRRQLLLVVGGNAFIDTPVAFQLGDDPGIWFSRDDQGYLLLNVKMLTNAVIGQPLPKRSRIVDNDWISRGQPADLICPPHGRLLDVRYEGGDQLKVEFSALKSPERVYRRYPWLDTKTLTRDRRAAMRLEMAQRWPELAERWVNEEQDEDPDDEFDPLDAMDFPITAVEVQMRVGGTNIRFGPREMAIGGTFTGCIFRRAGVGIRIDP